MDPFANFNFVLELDGVVAAAFHEVSGLSFDGEPATLNKPSGNIVFKHGIVFRNGLMRADLFETWRAASQIKPTEQACITIIVRDNQREVSIQRAWINKIEGPSLKAAPNDIAIETLEVTCEGITTNPIDCSDD